MFSTDYENGVEAAQIEIEKFAADSGSREASAIAAALLGRGAGASGLMADEGKGLKTGAGAHLGQMGGRLVANAAKKYSKGKIKGNAGMKELYQVGKRGGAGAGAYFSHGKNSKK